MIKEKGYVYHIDDNYFTIANDDKLLRNKENNNYRPHYYATKDNNGLIWAVPMSSQYEKYERIYNEKIAKYGKCDSIVLGSFDGRRTAFLLQNMFPVTERYIHHIHTRNNNPVPVNHKYQVQIDRNISKLKLLSQQGYKVVFTDIIRLEKIMLQELSINQQGQEQQPNTQTTDPILPNEIPDIGSQGFGGQGFGGLS